MVTRLKWVIKMTREKKKKKKNYDQILADFVKKCK